MTAPEHSPLPWADDGFGLKDAEGASVCIYGFIGATKQHASNRALIIAAVNAALLAAAKAALVADDSDYRVWADLKAAIAKAEEAL